MILPDIDITEMSDDQALDVLTNECGYTLEAAEAVLEVLRDPDGEGPALM